MSETTVRGTPADRRARPRPAPGRQVPPGRVPRQPSAPRSEPLAPSRSQRAGARPGASPRAASRMPFIILLCGLLGGGLVSTLVISTTLAEGAFQMTSLQQSDSTLAKQQQQLEEQVATARSAQVIEQRAYQLGMRPGQLRFLNLKTGKIQSAAGAGTTSATGYAP